MSQAIYDLAAEIFNLSEKVSVLNTGDKIYTTPMAKELTRREYFIGLAFQSLMTYAYPSKSVSEICIIAITAGTELADKIETQNHLQ
ncbi:MAG: hypothetical protein IH597_08705 [Bacteroidales bacterium]|nr:hypothetical protein [Bacteroidales bacterium]